MHNSEQDDILYDGSSSDATSPPPIPSQLEVFAAVAQKWVESYISTGHVFDPQFVVYDWTARWTIQIKI